MHILLTDLLTCPRCGPTQGLILLAHGVRDRRVSEGELGCSNCRERYRIEGGLGDLRAPPRPPLPDEEGGRPVPSKDEALELSALAGITEGPGFLLLAGSLGRFGSFMAPSMPQGVEVVSLGPPVPEVGRAASWSRIVSDPGKVPLFGGVVRAFALAGEEVESFLDEALRVLRRGGRLVVLDPPSGTPDRIREKGGELHLDDPRALVAVRA